MTAASGRRPVHNGLAGGQNSETVQFTPVEDPAGSEGTRPTGISNLGVIVGFYTDSSGIIHGFERSPAR